MVSQPNLVKKSAAENGVKGGKKKEVLDEQEIHALDKVSEDRIKSVLKYLKKFGVPDKFLFEIQDLKEMSNIPKVTRCIAMLGKLVSLSRLALFGQLEHERH